MNSKKYFFKALVLGAVIFLRAPAAEASISVGDKAPALVVTDVAGVKVDLSGMQGKTVIVALWASWCEPCRAELQVLRDFYHKYEDRGIEVISLSLDRPHDRKIVERIAARMDYPVAMASDASVNGFGDTDSLPVTYVINSEGKVRAVFDQKPVTEAVLVKAALP